MIVITVSAITTIGSFEQNCGDDPTATTPYQLTGLCSEIGT